MTCKHLGPLTEMPSYRLTRNDKEAATLLAKMVAHGRRTDANNGRASEDDLRELWRTVHGKITRRDEAVIREAERIWSCAAN